MTTTRAALAIVCVMASGACAKPEPAREAAEQPAASSSERELKKLEPFVDFRKENQLTRKQLPKAEKSCAGGDRDSCLAIADYYERDDSTLKFRHALDRLCSLPKTYCVFQPPQGPRWSNMSEEERKALGNARETRSVTRLSPKTREEMKKLGFFGAEKAETQTPLSQWTVELFE